MTRRLTSKCALLKAKRYPLGSAIGFLLNWINKRFFLCSPQMYIYYCSLHLLMQQNVKSLKHQGSEAPFDWGGAGRGWGGWVAEKGKAISLPESWGEKNSFPASKEGQTTGQFYQSSQAVSWTNCFPEMTFFFLTEYTSLEAWVQRADLVWPSNSQSHRPHSI